MRFTKFTYRSAIHYSVLRERTLRMELLHDKPYSLRWKLTKAALQHQTIRTCKLRARQLQETK